MSQMEALTLLGIHSTKYEEFLFTTLSICIVAAEVVKPPLTSRASVRDDRHAMPHLLVDLLGAHATPEHAGAGQVAAVAGVGCAHHVLGVEGLLRQLGDGQRPAEHSTHEKQAAWMLSQSFESLNTRRPHRYC
jgi:hypothetical protein